MERDLLVSQLRRNILGPRGGNAETIDRSEGGPDYIVGFLDPFGSTQREVGDEFIPEHVGNRGDPTDPGDHVVIDANFEGKPPSSMGVSFIVNGVSPEVEICATWARYKSCGEGGFQREPRSVVLEREGVGGIRNSQLHLEDDLELLLRSSPLSDDSDCSRVSLFLVNRSQAGGPKTELRVHQPQIRVNLHHPCELLPMNRDRSAHGDDDAASLDFLYRHRAGLARGHLVSAVWEKIDPEGFLPEEGECAFTWTDGLSLNDEQRERFTCPDVRTEYLPSLPIVSPDLDSWPGFSSDKPVLSALEIAESDSGEGLYQDLSPLVDGYSRWIEETKEAGETLRDYSVVMHRHMEACDSALERLQAGLESLRDNPLIRAAFQFANKSIHQANAWKSEDAFSWRPFQLAFIIENLNSISDRNHPDREICDLLWFPTGGGKTEAYLGIASFTMAYRRLRYPGEEGGGFTPGAGVSVISRYTLRLLTIQQFRRGASMVTSSERLRVLKTDEGLGWRPQGCGLEGDLPWGSTSFSIGMWVGGGVTPNSMQSRTIAGGVTIYGALRGEGGEPGLLERRGGSRESGEPAQILSCPACDSILSMTPDGLEAEQETELFLTLKSEPDREALSKYLDEEPGLANAEVRDVRGLGGGTFVLQLALTPLSKTPPRRMNEILWGALEGSMDTTRGAFHCINPTRPGYFALPEIDYAIICPNPRCELNRDVEWMDLTPSGPRPIPDAFRESSSRCPIPALSVDQEIYARCPSMIISTVDKFAGLAFNPECGNLFGNVEGHHRRHGYVRDTEGMYEDSFPLDGMNDRSGWADLRGTRFVPPDFILQDELHLIDGPLGSIVGLYEIGIRELTRGQGDLGAKYIASTATARNAGPQISSLYGLDVAVFPPQGMDIDDSFWARSSELPAGGIPDPGEGGPTPNPMNEETPGRLYVGLCAVGQSMQWTTVISWSATLQHIHERLADGADINRIDPYWTLVGYFNAVRELATAEAVVGQDVIGRINYLSKRNGTDARDTRALDVVDLSSRTASELLPALLDKLEKPVTTDVVIATSMFGTGVDIDRLGLMFVMGQPKTTSSYIQSTGRVGRSGGGLVITALRAGRPRDLNHYEFFSSYHNELYRHVEPVSVQPFSPNAVTRALGPVIVAMLRQADSLRGVPVGHLWRTKGRGELEWLQGGTGNDALKEAILEVIKGHNNSQPDARRMSEDELESFVLTGIHRWRLLADLYGPDLKYNEYTLSRPAEHPVVLGSEGHYLRGLDQVFPSAPNSMRDVESSLNFKSREDAF